MRLKRSGEWSLPKTGHRSKFIHLMNLSLIQGEKSLWHSWGLICEKNAKILTKSYKSVQMISTKASERRFTKTFWLWKTAIQLKIIWMVRLKPTIVSKKAMRKKCLNSKKRSKKKCPSLKRKGHLIQSRNKIEKKFLNLRPTCQVPAFKANCYFKTLSQQ